MRLPTLDDDMLDAEQLGRVLKLDRRTIYAMIHRDGLPCVRISRRAIRFEKRAVAKWLLAKHDEAKNEAA